MRIRCFPAMRDVIDIHWRQLGMGRSMTALVNNDRGRRSPSKWSWRRVCARDVRRVMDDITRSAGIGTVDRASAIVDM
jgi:hypothetical protein